mgnify:CR=1 FL=1
MSESPDRPRRQRPGDIPPEMNVTPLVDVVLVLLIIFMVVAPRLNQDVQVDLPGIFNPDPEAKAIDPVKVTVAKAGEFWINEQQYDLDGAMQVLATEHENDPARRIVLRADQKLKYGVVREMLGRAQDLGFPGLSFMVGEKHREGAEPSGAPAPAPPPSAEG